MSAPKGAREAAAESQTDPEMARIAPHLSPSETSRIRAHGGERCADLP
jgi:hypothetical protein